MIIPTWNRSGTVLAAIESVLTQSVPVLEVLVCDDGSTDDTAAQVATVAARDPRLRWLPGARAGRPAIPRNRGIRESRGDWLAFLDSDDTWLPHKIAVQLEAARRLDCGAACADAVRVAGGTGEAGPLLGWSRPLLSLSDLLQGNRVVCSSSLVRRSVIAHAGGFPEDPEFKAVEDYALWLRVSVLTDWAYCAEPLVRYRDDPRSSIRGKQDLAPEAQRRLVVGHLQDWLTSGAWRALSHFPALLKVLALRHRLAKEAAEAANR